MITLNKRHREALEHCREAIRNCSRYHTHPAPYFPLALLMYAELEKQGLIQWEDEPSP